MAYVNVQNVIVYDNPTAFTNEFKFEITFESVMPLEQDLDWKVTYVGNADDQELDQVLEEVAVGPVPEGLNKFVLTAPAPDPQRINEDDLIGVTVILITCSYLNQEFIRIGYYVDNDYEQPVDRENPPRPVDINLLRRNIMANEPRVTRIPINWTGDAGAIPVDAEAAAEAQAYEERNEQMGTEEGEGEDEAEEDSEDGDNEIDISGEFMGNDDSMDVEQMQTTVA